MDKVKLEVREKDNVIEIRSHNLSKEETLRICASLIVGMCKNPKQIGVAMAYILDACADLWSGDKLTTINVSMNEYMAHYNGQEENNGDDAE